MTGTRLFFTFCILLSAALVIAVSAGMMGQPHAMSPEAAQGWEVWRNTGCEGCHTIYGQGGAYAPDLTHIFELRGEGYLREFWANPGAFHPGERIMPAFGLTKNETDNLFAFLKWVGEQPPAQTWPPRPILVSGGSPLSGGAADTAASSENLPDDPAARGQLWFSHTPAICSTCHSLEADVVVVGPSLAGVATRAETRVQGMSAEQYLRDSILNPGDFVVPGFRDAMQRNFGDTLTGEQINDLIAFLLTQK
jgi:nitric oxide reductase subunit C